MKITGLDHITVNVKDLAASKRFYETILGLEACGFIDMGDHTLTYYQLPMGVRLELIDYAEKTAAEDIHETYTGIYRHFCLSADSLDEIKARCDEAGVYVRKEPSWVDKLGCNTMLITDPSGVEIELISR